MGDEDDADAAARDVADQLEDGLDLLGSERGRGLVEDEHLRVEGDGSRDGNGLALATGQRGDALIGLPDADMQALKMARGLGVHDLVVHPASPAVVRFTAKEQVRRDIQVVAQRQILVDHLDTVSTGRSRPGQRERLAIDEDTAGVRHLGT